jgi:hypothetical protein
MALQAARSARPAGVLADTASSRHDGDLDQGDLHGLLDGHDPAASSARRCAGRRRAGGLPTETVYGLARGPTTTRRGGIFAAKGRPADHPLIVHVADRGVESFA